MEYMTNWDQAPRPKSAAGPRGGNNNFDYSKYKGGYKSPRKIDYSYSPVGYEEKVPFGQLSVRDLVQRVERARRQSPFYEEFKHNDPVLTGALPASLSASSISVCSSKDSYDADGVIRMQPVIPNMKLSTPGFDHDEQRPRRMKRLRKYSERSAKRVGRFNLTIAS